MNLELPNINYIELDELNFILYIMPIKENEKENKDFFVYRLLVGY